jgi:hypothetical protein
MTQTREIDNLSIDLLSESGLLIYEECTVVQLSIFKDK